MQQYQGYDTPQEILTRIKFIGTIQPGEKIDTANLRVETNNIITPLKRTIFGESRSVTYSFLHNTIDRAFAILHSYATTDKISDRMMCANIMKDLSKAIFGLRNMQTTYKEDKMCVCNLETLIEAIDARMVEVRDKYPDIVKLTLVNSPAVQSQQPAAEPPKIDIGEEKSKREEKKGTDKK